MTTKSQTPECSFRSLRYRCYCIAALAVTTPLLVYVFLAVKGGFTALVPKFLNPALLESDLFVLIYSSVLGLILFAAILFVWEHYRWFVRETTFRVESGIIHIEDGRKKHEIRVDQISAVRMYANQFWLLNGRFTAPYYGYKIYKLTMQTTTLKYKFYSTPFRGHLFKEKEPDDFLNFAEMLKKAGVPVETIIKPYLANPPLPSKKRSEKDSSSR